MKSIIIIFLCSLSVNVFPCFAQERNELPMYGGIPPTPEQAKADQQFIDNIVKMLGSREAGARDAVRVGFKYLEKGDSSTAIKRFNQAWLLNGENAEVLWGFGAALSYQKKFTDSETYFLKAIALSPNNGHLINDFGFMYQFWATRATKEQEEKEKRIDLSIQLFMQASHLEPQYERVYFNWAISLFFKQDYKGAWDKIKEAEKLGGKTIEEKFIQDLSKKMPRP